MRKRQPDANPIPWVNTIIVMCRSVASVAGRMCVFHEGRILAEGPPTQVVGWPRRFGDPDVPGRGSRDRKGSG